MSLASFSPAKTSLLIKHALQPVAGSVLSAEEGGLDWDAQILSEVWHSRAARRLAQADFRKRHG
jgi:hypothetical protein